MPGIIDAWRGGLIAFGMFLPRLLGAIVIFIIAWIVAAILRRVVDRILDRFSFDQWVQNMGGQSRTAERMMAFDPSMWVARLVFWIVLISGFLLAVNTLGLTAINTLVVRAVAYLPLVIVAIIEVVLAIVIGSLVFEVISGSAGDVAGGRTMARAAEYVIITIGVMAALSQLGIAPLIVNTLFIAFILTVALIASIAFGVGGIETARKVLEQWYAAGQQKAEELRKAQAQAEAQTQKRKPAA